VNELFDVEANRKAQKWSSRALFVRVLWGFAHPFFRFSPRLLWGWRNMMLRLFGEKIGAGVRIFPNVQIIIPWNLNIGDHCTVGKGAILYALGEVTIGPRTTVSQGAHVCGGTHDWRDPTMPLIKSPVTIGADVWVAADAFVGPDVVIGEGAILGARAVVTKSVPAGSIMAGNPAKQIGRRFQEPAKPDLTIMGGHAPASDP
jgi:putative colanic acid biosynthesis acetyltransferase WcaF